MSDALQTNSDATVSLIDDDPDCRRGMSLLLRSVGLKVEAYCSAEEFLASDSLRGCGCLIVDVRLQGISGLELQQQLNEANSRVPIIFTSAYSEVALVSRALRAGALEFLQKPYSPQELIESVHEALEVSRRAILRRREQEAIESQLAQLSGREHKVMWLLADGMNTKSIATQLAISPKTVDNHRARILSKLQIDNVAQLARLLIGRDLARP